MALAPDAAQDPHSALRLFTAASAERVPLPLWAGDIGVRVAPLDRELVLDVPKQPRRLYRRIKKTKGFLCPQIEVERRQITLRCNSALLDARILRRGKKRYLEIHELRGLPWRFGMDGPPPLHFPPEFTGLADACPSDTPAGKGECAFGKGNFLTSARWFRKALRSSDKGYAALRLGDLSLIAGDPAAAFTWFKRASIIGPVGRLAGVRLCELNLGCIERYPNLNDNPQDLADPFRDDVMLRQARAAAFRDDLIGALDILFRSFEFFKSDSLCKGGGLVLCRRIVLTALRKAAGGRAKSQARINPAGEKKTGSMGDDERGERRSEIDLAVTNAKRVLSLYLMLPQREVGGLATELAQEAGELAYRLGAPRFGAGLMGRVSGLLKGKEQELHLRRVTELYLLGRDPIRAGVVMDYARVRFGKRRLQTHPEWRRLEAWRRRPHDVFSDPGREHEDAEKVRLAAALADTLAATERAQRLTSELGKLTGLTGLTFPDGGALTSLGDITSEEADGGVVPDSNPAIERKGLSLEDEEAL